MFVGASKYANLSVTFSGLLSNRGQCQGKAEVSIQCVLVTLGPSFVCMFIIICVISSKTEGSLYCCYSLKGVFLFNDNL